MKILVFEYITGGGFAGQSLPAGLAAEGGQMLQALLHELKALPGIELTVMLDSRCQPSNVLTEAEVVRVNHPDIRTILPKLLNATDCFWPIAPETDGILHTLAEIAAANRTPTLLSDPATLAVCADKLASYRVFCTLGLPAVPTRSLVDDFADWRGRLVVKPVDGVGCEGARLLTTEQFSDWRNRCSDPMRYVVQPYCEGRPSSLSALFAGGRAWLLSVNRQLIEVVDGGFALRGCRVNVAVASRSLYQGWLDQLVVGLPGLFGYVGVDWLETADGGGQLLEINPRLTSSYAGVGQAIGINVAEQVLRCLDGVPESFQTDSQTVDIIFNH
ncbi:ATP-grasp domain-containing protein [Methylomonas sp. CM2]|uniref:ATP-grasp domain-containing protein n=1 Tax=Methylomonas sp. CM2 TaxID=3417647 RepID=UPI003CEFF40B